MLAILLIVAAYVVFFSWAWYRSPHRRASEDITMERASRSHRFKQ